MNKVYEIENESAENYIVTFNDENGIIKASCTCPAGQHCTLCKHVIKYMLEDNEIAESLKEYGLMKVYNEYIETNEKADKLKEEAKKIKKKFARLLLGNYRDKKN